MDAHNYYWWIPVSGILAFGGLQASKEHPELAMLAFIVAGIVAIIGVLILPIYWSIKSPGSNLSDLLDDDGGKVSVERLTKALSYWSSGTVSSGRMRLDGMTVTFGGRPGRLHVSIKVSGKLWLDELLPPVRRRVDDMADDLKGDRWTANGLEFRVRGTTSEAERDITTAVDAVAIAALARKGPVAQLDEMNARGVLVADDIAPALNAVEPDERKAMVANIVQWRRPDYVVGAASYLQAPERVAVLADLLQRYDRFSGQQDAFRHIRAAATEPGVSPDDLERGLTYALVNGEAKWADDVLEALQEHARDELAVLQSVLDHPTSEQVRNDVRERVVELSAASPNAGRLAIAEDAMQEGAVALVEGEGALSETSE